MNMKIPAAALATTLAVVGAFSADRPLNANLFAKNNLIAWCIVPFDAAHRGPVERAQMLKRRNLKTEIWYMYRPPAGFDALSQDEKVAQATKAVKYLAVEAQKLHCKLGIYNHGGWYGEPENELAILQAVGMPNVGLVYNFSHGQAQIDRFPTFFPKILPHLLAVNIDGMKKEGPRIITVGEGTSELDMLKLVRSSGFKGPIGILNESAERDAEVGLAGNMAGLQKMLRVMGDKAALKTY